MAGASNFDKTREPHCRNALSFRVLFVVFVLLLTVSVPSAAFADDAKEKIFDGVEDQLSRLDLSAFDQFLSELDSETYAIFDAPSFADKVRTLLRGEVFLPNVSFFQGIATLLFSGVKNLLPLFVSVALTGILSGLLGNARSSFSSKTTGELIHFVCFAAIVLLMTGAILEVTKLTRDCVLGMQTQMSAIMPILLTLMTALGTTVSANVYRPAVALLANGVANVLTNIVVPFFILACVLTVVGSLSTSVRLGKLANFFKNTSIWIMGAAFTVFMAFLSIQGITAVTVDGISVRAAKYAIGNSIPLVGGYVKDGFDLILAGSVLLKNAIGVSGLILLVLSILSPLLQIVAFAIGLKLVAALIEPISDVRVSNFLSDLSKNVSTLISVIIGTAFLYFILLMLVILSSNGIFGG